MEKGLFTIYIQKLSEKSWTGKFLKKLTPTSLCLWSITILRLFLNFPFGIRTLKRYIITVFYIELLYLEYNWWMQQNMFIKVIVYR